MQHRQLVHIAAEKLRSMIAAGELQSGEWLRQGRLSSELGISFTPIREALKQLAAEGLVEHVPYRGVRVASFSADDVLDLYTMRGVLEGLAAASAAERLTAEQLSHLQTLHQRMCGLSGAAHLIEVRDLNRQFHLTVVEASGRVYLIRTVKAIWGWFPTMLWNNAAAITPAYLLERERADNHEHADILAALASRDGAAAEHLMRHHIDRARLALIDHLRANGNGN